MFAIIPATNLESRVRIYRHQQVSTYHCVLSNEQRVHLFACLRKAAAKKGVDFLRLCVTMLGRYRKVKVLVNFLSDIAPPLTVLHEANVKIPGGTEIMSTLSAVGMHVRNVSRAYSSFMTETLRSE